MREAVQKVATVLSNPLGGTVELEGRVLAATTNPFEVLAQQAGFAVLELSAVGAKAVLEVELPLLVALLERIAGSSEGAGPATRLTRIEEAAFGYLVLLSLSALRPVEFLEKRFAPRLISVHGDRGEALDHIDTTPRQIAFALTVTLGEVTGSARVYVPAAAVQASVQDVPVHQELPIASEVMAAGLVARVFAGRAALALDDLMELCEGDVVMFSGLTMSAGRLSGPGRLVTRTFELHGNCCDKGFTFSRATLRAFTQESMMSSKHDVANEPTQQLPIEVEIELARVRLSVAELAQLQVGAVLPLHIHLAEPVILRVGDREVARAELVDIEGEVGTRILALLSKER